MDANKIAFITCVNEEEVYSECLVYINHLLVPEGYEVETISIRNAQSIASAYNKVQEATNAKYKVYLHQDVFIINKNFIFDILKIFKQEKGIGLLGVIGAKNLPPNGIWWEANEKYGCVYDSHTGIMGEISFLKSVEPFEKVMCVDGLIMITQYDIKWCEEIFNGWHYYDISQSMEYKIANYEIAVVSQNTPWVIHDSGVANVNNGFEVYRKKFLDTYQEILNPNKNKIRIAFLEATNNYDLRSDASMAYQQIKSYVLKYSKYKDDIVMNFYSSVDKVPNNIDIIGVGATSQNFFQSCVLGKELRERCSKALIVLGGHHISYFPKELPESYNIGVMFEGEQTFLELLDQYVENDKKLDSLRPIRGTVVRGIDGNLRIEEQNELITPLDKIPFPCFEGNQPYVFSSRGCPYDCSFCSSTEYWKCYRTYSAEYVIAQIEHIVKNYPGIQRIMFWDDLVIADKVRFEKIVNMIVERGINNIVSFSLAVRANLVNDDICKLLKKINISFVSFGAESGSDRVLQMLKGKSVTVDINQHALDLLHKYGVFVTCGFIIGSPTETIDDVRKTFDFILHNVVDGKMGDCAINVLMPLPGTAMWRYAINNKIITEPVDWRRMQIFASYKNSNFSDINTWVAERLKTESYYLNEAYIPQKELLEMLANFERVLSKIVSCMRSGNRN